MKPLIITVLIIFLFFKNSSCQNKMEIPYKGGSAKLNADLSEYISGEANIKFDDTAFVFILQISENKSSVEPGNKIKIEIFGKNSPMKKLLQQFFNINKINWEHERIKKRNIILPIFIAAYGATNKEPYFNWKDIFDKAIPENQIAFFVRPVVIELYCCLSEPNRDF